MTLAPGGAPPDPLTIRLYDKIEEIRGDVAAMASDVRNLATKIEPVVSQVVDHEARLRVVETHATASADHEQRITSLEKRVWMAAGASALLAGAAGAVATLLASAGR
jgi:DNA-binding ferritin-like protein